MNPDRDFLWADWPAPAHIRAGTTLRTGGVSAAPYDELNLGTHTGDRREAVLKNRAAVRSALALPAEPVWLNQVHGVRVACADRAVTVAADAAVARRHGSVCAVLTADCLPVVFCDRKGDAWAAAHAGWRGLAGGVLESVVARLGVEPSELLAWLGPSLGAHNFEVGTDVLAAFQTHDPAATAMFKSSLKSGKYLADIYALARARLRRAGVENIYGGGLCTLDEDQRFYSYRRESPTGRMATLIWSTS